jgi:hypothetical protein
MAEEFKCTVQCVCRALNGQKESDLAINIRKRALALGGVKKPIRRLIGTRLIGGSGEVDGESTKVDGGGR